MLRSKQDATMLLLQEVFCCGTRLILRERTIKLITYFKVPNGR
jgi:hypothetical protein